MILILFLNAKVAVPQTEIGGELSANTTLIKAGSPYLINSVTVPEGITLTIEAGAVLKFNGSWENINVYGTFDATDTTDKPVYFTALSDDSLGGDNNGDANATAPAPGSWAALWFRDVSTGNILKNCIIKYGGGSGTSAALNIYTSSVSVDRSEVSYSTARGIYIGGANPSVQRSKIANNNTDGIYTTSGALPVLSNNQITDNVYFGVNNVDGSVDVDARNNWWGDSTGPYHASLNPSGQGNPVSDHVLFDPWNITTSVSEINLNEGLVLGQHYPNPASGKITVPFEMEKTGRVLLRLVNMEGKVLKTILDESRAAGAHQVEFNSEGLTNGTYLLRLTSGNSSKVSRMIVVN